MRETLGVVLPGEVGRMVEERVGVAMESWFGRMFGGKRGRLVLEP